MTERPEQPPEGRLIALAQKRAKLSGRRAAGQAGMSEGRWRQIVSGYQTVSAEVYAPVHAPPGTLARMAEVVGVTPEQLADAGRDDAADELRERLLQPTGRPDDGLSTEEKLQLAFERLDALTARVNELTERDRAVSDAAPEERDLDMG